MAAILAMSPDEKAQTQNYAPALRWLHWIMAATIFAAIALALLVVELPRGELRSEILFVHKSFGMTALVLVAMRVFVRLAVGAPSYEPPLAPLTRFAARAAHALLYVLMIAMPVSGYVLSTAGNSYAPWFGLFVFPSVLPRDKALAQAGGLAHWCLAWTIGAVLALHLAAVAWHRFVKRDDVLARMWPAKGRRQR